MLSDPVRNEPCLTSSLASSIQLRTLLDQTFDNLISSNSVDSGLSSLMRGLWKLRRTTGREVWRRLIREGREHPLYGLLQQDPMTDWSFKRPRGYPGDAVLLDHTYEEGPVVEERVQQATEMGRKIYRWLVTYSGVTGLKERCRFIASLLDATAANVRNAKVLSLACGHARELAWSKAVMQRELRFLGIDQDRESLETLKSCYGPVHVETEICTVKDLLKNPGRFHGFDLVYSTGLFDYLPDSLAQSLISVMVSMAKPGGRVVIANGFEGVEDAGYIEMFMDWELIYRTEAQMENLLSRTPSKLINDWRVFGQLSRHFIYLDVRKAP